MSRRSEKNLISSDDLAKQIIEHGQKKENKKLEELIAKCDSKLLERMIVKRIDRKDATILWNYLLIGCNSNSNSEAMSHTRFFILMAVLDEMNKVEISSKQTFDIITRTFIELPKLRPTELMRLCQYCVESLRIGDPKCTGWKELFPELMKLLGVMPKINVHGEIKTGSEYCDSQIKSLLTIRWPETILSSIGAMFLEMPITKNDKFLVLNKLCENLLKLEPQELPTLAFQMFTLSTTPAQLMIPLVSLNQYFQKYLYKKQLEESPDSEELNFDSIDRFSDDDLVSAQNTILYHLSSCSEYKISEKEMIQQIRTMASNPSYVLSPFMLSALLTICNVSRYLDSVRLSVSSALPFIRTVIQNNEKEMDMCNTSAWFRDELQYSTVNVDKVYSILVEQSKEDIFTPGLVGMAFVLLKTPQYSNINILGITFLVEMVRARHQLSYGILRNLKEFLFADQEAPQYAECLTKLSESCPNLSEHILQIKEIIDFFLLIPGHHAMRMMTFILQLTKSNPQIREYFIDMLRRAMYQSNISTRQMAVYGFCLMLKQLRVSSAWRSSGRGGSTQLSISGFSVMSQQLHGSGNNPNAAFDMCVLEIIGILRKCFNQTIEIKEILYDGLISAIQQNSKLITHILQFLELHFRSYFNEIGDSIEINFDKAISEINPGDTTNIQVTDHIGKLLQFITQCIILLEQHGYDHDINDLKEFFDKLLNKINTITLKELGLETVITPLTSHIGLQFLNCLEGLMYYSLKMNNIDESVEIIIRLFKHHKKCHDQFQESFAAAKKTNRKKSDEANLSGHLKAMAQINSLKPENVWDLIAVHGFLEAICRRSQAPNLLWKETDFCIYVLDVTRAKVEGMRSAPEYKQLKYSKSNYKLLNCISALMLKIFIKNLKNMFDDSGIELVHAAVNCFHECISTAVALYERKFLDFLQKLDVEKQSNDVNMNLINILHNVVNEIVILFEDNDVEPQHQTILQKLFQCLEMLYSSIVLKEDEAKEVHSWLCDYCKSHSINGVEHVIVHKLLLTQRIRTQRGPIFEGIAKQIELVLEQIQAEPVEDADQYKSINELTVEACFNQLCNVVRKQIEDIEYFILKVKSHCAQLKTGGLNDENRKTCEDRMIRMERSISTQLIFISRVCIHLSNGMQPVGSCTDNFTRLLTQFYVCLGNLTKHFINRQKIAPVSYKQTKFDQLVQTIGKKLPSKIYSMIQYIEENIFPDHKEDENNEDAPKRLKKNDGKNNAAKVMRNMKNVPRLIKSLENFSKYITTLSKKTEHDLTKCLHIGTVRDFRIKTSELRTAIDKLRENDSDENESTADDDETIDSDDDNDDDTEAVSETTSSVTATSSNIGSTGSIINEVQHDTSLLTTAMKNLNTINKRTSKRKKKDMENIENDNNDDTDNNQRRKKRKDNDQNDDADVSTSTRRSRRRNPNK